MFRLFAISNEHLPRTPSPEDWPAHRKSAFWEHSELASRPVPQRGQINTGGLISYTARKPEIHIYDLSVHSRREFAIILLLALRSAQNGARRRVVLRDPPKI